MKATIGGVTYEGSEEEVKRMVEWHKAQEPHVTIASGCGLIRVQKRGTASSRAADTDDVPISIRRILGGKKTTRKRNDCDGCVHTGGASRGNMPPACDMRMVARRGGTSSPGLGKTGW